MCGKNRGTINCAQLICEFIFAYADCWFSYVAAQLLSDNEYQGPPRTNVGCGVSCRNEECKSRGNTQGINRFTLKGPEKGRKWEGCMEIS